MFIGLNPEVLYQLTYPDDAISDDEDVVLGQTDDTLDTLSEKNPIGGGKKTDRYEEISREVSGKKR